MKQKCLLNYKSTRSCPTPTLNTILTRISVLCKIKTAFPLLPPYLLFEFPGFKLAWFNRIFLFSIAHWPSTKMI